jgi:hypothetical protein
MKDIINEVAAGLLAFCLWICNNPGRISFISESNSNTLNQGEIGAPQNLDVQS